MQEQLVNILLIIQKILKDIDFTVLPIARELLKLRMFGSLEMVKIFGAKIFKI